LSQGGGFCFSFFHCKIRGPIRGPKVCHNNKAFGIYFFTQNAARNTQRRRCRRSACGNSVDSCQRVEHMSAQQTQTSPKRPNPKRCVRDYCEGSSVSVDCTRRGLVPTVLCSVAQRGREVLRVKKKVESRASPVNVAGAARYCTPLRRPHPRYRV
jgi:hypothetical protein